MDGYHAVVAMMTLPYPPSMNHYWVRNPHRGMRISDEGERYRSLTGDVLRSYGLSFGQQRLKLVVGVWVPDRRRRDIDNLWKPMLDALKHGGLYDDDEQVDHEAMIRLGLDRESPRVEVFVKALPDDWDALREFAESCR